MVTIARGAHLTIDGQPVNGLVKFQDGARGDPAEKRRAEIREVLRALVPAEDMSGSELENITEHHYIVVPRRIVDEHPALRSFDFVRAHDMSSERVYVVNGRLTKLVDWGDRRAQREG